MSEVEITHLGAFKFNRPNIVLDLLTLFAINRTLFSNGEDQKSAGRVHF